MNFTQFLASILTFSSVVLAGDFKPMSIDYSRETRARVLEVQLLESKLEYNVTGVYENRELVVRIGLNARASACEDMIDLRYVSGQSSIDNTLNPSDHYLAVRTKWRDGCITGMMGTPENLSIQLKFYAGQRKLGSNAPFYFNPKEGVHHYSFDAGMEGGLNRWMMYKLDFSDFDKISFEQIKTFSYVQGQIK